MARLDRPTSENPNPAKKFLHWKSNDKRFSYYDKELKEDVPVELPFKFLFLEHYHTVKGWNDASESGIFSNEVYSIGKEELTVKPFKGSEIASGLYKEIKNKIKDAGAVYYRSIYAMTEDGSIINLQIKGSAVSNYSEFYKDHNHLLDNQWIEIKEAEEGKKGSIKYSKPVFIIGDVIDRKTDKMAIEAANTLQEYIISYMAKDVKEIEVKEPEIVGDEPTGSDKGSDDGLNF